MSEDRLQKLQDTEKEQDTEREQDVDRLQDTDRVQDTERELTEKELDLRVLLATKPSAEHADLHDGITARNSVHPVFDCTQVEDSLAFEGAIIDGTRVLDEISAELARWRTDPFHLYMKKAQVIAGLHVERRLLQIARDSNMCHGRWVFAVPHAIADEIWELIAASTVDGHLGYMATISSCCIPHKTVHAVSVCFADVFNVNEVRRGMQRLQMLGIEQRMHFKLDLYVHLEINSRNTWGLNATLFSSESVFTDETAAYLAGFTNKLDVV